MRTATGENVTDSGSPAGAAARGLLPLVASVVVIVSAAFFVQAAFIGYELARSAMLTLLTGSCALAAGLLLINRRAFMEQTRAPGGSLRLDVAHAALAALVAIGFIVLTGNADGRMVALAAACFVLVWLVGTAISLLERRGVPAPLGASISASVAMLTSAAPLWLAPLAELWQGSGLVNFALAVSPLTLLAVPADFDYLRTGWFYQHSALGALRYTYPPAWALIATYALLPAVHAWSCRKRRMRHNRGASTTKA